jgi:hypothetical protein
MAEKIMFKIGLTDYSNHVVGENYSVQSNDEYETWTDANGKEHRSAYRQRISGTFELYFTDEAEYLTFQSVLEANKRTDLTYPITIYDSRTGNEEDIFAFVTYNITLYRNPAFVDRVEQIKVTIKEQ